MFKHINRKADSRKRHQRVRSRIMGTAERPRLTVYRSLHHIYAQIIDDVKGVTLVSSSTMENALKDKLENGCNIEAAKAIGKAVAEKAQNMGVKQVVFDRGGHIYHGRIKALAEAAREAGLEF